MGSLGGLAGRIQANATQVLCSYFAAKIPPSINYTGSVIGNVLCLSSLYANKVYYDNSSSSYLAIGGVGTSSSFVGMKGLNCYDLFDTVNNSFPSSYWGGGRLKIEANYSPGTCPCPFITSYSPTTNHPTFYSPTNPLPTTQIPTTQILTTHFPSTQIPTTQILTTQIPSTQILTTKFSATFTPTSHFPSTTVSTSFAPSTPTPTSSSTPPCTNASTTNLPPTSTPLLCFYTVPNCSFCTQNAPLFDLTQGNVSCILSSGEWRWTFTPNSGALVNTGEIVVNGNTTTLIEGNFENNANLNISSGSSVVVAGNLTQASGGQIVFTFNPQQNNKSSPLNVGGCVSINGNISLNLETQPQQGTTNFQVISYNCSQRVNISSSQIGVIPNYNGSSCDTINSQAINQPNSLGVSLISTLGNKCNGGKNLGLVIGISVGIPCGMVLALGLSLAAYQYSRKKEFNQKMDNLGVEMKQGNQEWKENKKAVNQGTVWTENISDNN